MFCNAVIKSPVFVLLMVCSASTVLAQEFKAGEWEFEVRHTISGMPSRVPAKKYRQCLTQDNPIPTVFLQARSCKVLEQQKRHYRISYRINCFTEHGTLINEGMLRFGPVKMSGTSKSDLGDAVGRNSVIRYKYRGRYIGQCQ